MLAMIGFRLIEKIDKLGIKPAPIATPAEEIDGILLAGCLEPGGVVRKTCNI